MTSRGPTFAYYIVQNKLLRGRLRLVDSGRRSIGDTKWMVFGDLLSIVPEGQGPVDALRLYRDEALDRIRGWADGLLRSRELFCIEVETGRPVDGSETDSVMASVCEQIQDAGFLHVDTDYRYSPNAVETRLVSGALVDLPVKIGRRLNFYRQTEGGEPLADPDDLLKRVMFLEIFGQRERARELITEHADILPEWCRLRDALLLLTELETTPPSPPAKPWIKRFFDLAKSISLSNGSRHTSGAR
jgi:hypothetical protein